MNQAPNRSSPLPVLAMAGNYKNNSYLRILDGG
jgi:hypothetical protein